MSTAVHAPTGYRFNAPPTWPTPPAGWVPEPGWQPDPSWPAAPAGWQFWVPEQRQPAAALVPAAPVQPMYAPQPVPVQTMPTRTVTKQRVKTQHSFHLIMTLCTCGLWPLVWLPTWLFNSMRRQKVVSYTR